MKLHSYWVLFLLKHVILRHFHKLIPILAPSTVKPAGIAGGLTCFSGGMGSLGSAAWCAIMAGDDKAERVEADRPEVPSPDKPRVLSPGVETPPTVRRHPRCDARLATRRAAAAVDRADRDAMLSCTESREAWSTGRVPKTAKDTRSAAGTHKSTHHPHPHTVAHSFLLFGFGHIMPEPCNYGLNKYTARTPFGANSHATSPSVRTYAPKTRLLLM